MSTEIMLTRSKTDREMWEMTTQDGDRTTLWAVVHGDIIYALTGNNDFNVNKVRIMPEKCEVE